MDVQATLVREQLARCIDEIDDDFVVAVGPLLMRIAAVVQRFFASPRDAGDDVSIRMQSGEVVVGGRASDRPTDV